jgi:hypothetical protein
VTEPDLEQAIDELYAAAPEEFVPRRNALAKELTKAGRRPEAEEVRALRKPTLSAWLANQLARQEKAAVEALLDAGEDLKRTQQALLSGGDARELQRGREELRALVRRLSDAGRATLAEDDRAASEAMLERLASTLEAAALDDGARQLLARGRLTEDVDLPGFEALSPPAAGVPPRAPTRRDAEAPARKRQEADAPARKREQVDAAARKREQAEAAARERREAEAVRKAELSQLRESVRRARAETRDLRSQERDALRKADRARSEAARLEAAATRLGERLADAEEAVRQAEERLERLA